MKGYRSAQSHDFVFCQHICSQFYVGCSWFYPAKKFISCFDTPGEQGDTFWPNYPTFFALNNSIIDNWHSHEKNKLSKQNNILQLLKQNYVLENDQYVTIINLNSSKVYKEKNTTRSKVTLWSNHIVADGFPRWLN